MGKTILKVGCIDQRLILIADPEIASGGQNEDVVEFEFCSLWDGYGKTAVFYRTEDEVYRVYVEGDRCIIPHEVLRDEGVMYFGVFGVKGDTTRTSEVIRYRLVKGALTSGSAPSDPTPDIYAALLARIGAIETILAKPYTLPTASADVKGGVKIGPGLQMDDEVLSTEVKKEHIDQLSEESVKITPQGFSDEQKAQARVNIDAAKDEHAHGNITTDGKLGSVTGRIVTTGTDGKMEASTASAAREKLGLKPVASSGKYSDLEDTPVVDGTVSADGTNAVSGAAVAAYVTQQLAAITDYEGVEF